MTMVASHWSANPWALAGCAAVVAGHLLGLGRLARDARRDGQRLAAAHAREAAAFYVGVLVVLLALVSPVGFWAQRFVWVRSVQDLLLAVIAPALLVLGAPWQPLRRGLRTRRGRPVRDADQSTRPEADLPTREAPGWVPLPVLVMVAFNLAWCAWHLAGPYDAARSHPAAFTLEVASYLGLGVLFWLQLIGSAPHVPRLAPLRRALLLTVTAIVSTMLAVVLVFGTQVVYPGYRGTWHHLLSLVQDQQVGGAVLWVITLVPYSVAGFTLLVKWLHAEDAAADLDRVLKPAMAAKSAWPSRPGHSGVFWPIGSGGSPPGQYRPPPGQH
jgi:cytochrome c oxidase assembly factor CtaG